MKWWIRLKELRRNRWLPFYLPIIGTLLYIALVLILIPTEVGDKESEGTDAEPSASASAAASARAAPPRRVRPVPQPVGTLTPPH